MQLKIISRKETRIIKLNPAFFTDQQEKRNGLMIKLTPRDKALQIGQQLFRGDYIGHELTLNGKMIQNTLDKNRRSKEEFGSSNKHPNFREKSSNIAHGSDRHFSQKVKSLFKE